MDNQALSIQSSTIQQSSLMDATISNIEKATQLAEYIKNSRFGKNFETIDDKNNTVIKTEDIVAAILFGAELGLSPMKTMALGNQLNKNTYFAVARGRSMNLDEITAIQNIHVFTTGSGRVCIYTGVHIISKVIHDAGVRIEWIDDYKIVYKYYDSVTKEEINSSEVEIPDSRYFIVTSSSTAEEVKAAQTAGKKFVTRKPDRLTSAIFHKPDGSSTHIKFYLSEAIEAELYKGVKSDGSQVAGKDNWNKYPSRQMRNRVIMYGGRECAANKLFDTYLPDEVSSIDPNARIVEDINHEEL